MLASAASGWRWQLQMAFPFCTWMVLGRSLLLIATSFKGVIKPGLELFWSFMVLAHIFWLTELSPMLWPSSNLNNYGLSWNFSMILEFSLIPWDSSLMFFIMNMWILSCGSSWIPPHEWPRNFFQRNKLCGEGRERAIFYPHGSSESLCLCPWCFIQRFLSHLLTQ